jgi:hypothetical protein
MLMVDKEPRYETEEAAKILVRAVAQRGWPAPSGVTDPRTAAADRLLGAVHDALKTAMAQSPPNALAVKEEADGVLHVSGTPRGGAQARTIVSLRADAAKGIILERAAASFGAKVTPVSAPTLDFDPLDNRFVGRTDAAIAVADAIVRAIFGSA